MENERSVDKLSRYIMYAAGALIIAGLCWYFRNVLIYIIVAAVVSLAGRPIKHVLGIPKIKGKSAPDWLRAIITLIIIIGIIVGLITVIFPIIFSIVQNISSNLQQAQVNASGLTALLNKWNRMIIQTFPDLGKDFTLQGATVDLIRKTFSIGSVTSAVGSVASVLGDIAIAIFSIVFIGFFFIKDERLFRNIIAGIVPERLEERAVEAIGDIEHLLSRYFGGLLLEVMGVAVLNFLGLSLVAKVGVNAALGIAFMTGILNVIPYVGPWIGGAVGTVLGVILKYSTAFAAGTQMNVLIVIGILLACFVFTQLVDNFFFQPFIYSTSIKSSPLEIFIVLLIAGHLGGILGMLVAIPSYTVIRVIAVEFFYDIKAIQRLIPEKESTKVTPNKKRK